MRGVIHSLAAVDVEGAASEGGAPPSPAVPARVDVAAVVAALWLVAHARVRVVAREEVAHVSHDLGMLVLFPVRVACVPRVNAAAPAQQR